MGFQSSHAVCFVKNLVLKIGHRHTWLAHYLLVDYTLDCIVRSLCASGMIYMSPYCNVDAFAVDSMKRFIVSPILAIGAVWCAAQAVKSMGNGVDYVGRWVRLTVWANLV